jgi:hypothetical protein
MYTHSIETGNEVQKNESSRRWGKHYIDKRNWQQYNEELVIRGKMIFDMDFRDQWTQN